LKSFDFDFFVGDVTFQAGLGLFRCRHWALGSKITGQFLVVFFNWQKSVQVLESLIDLLAFVDGEL